MASGKNIFKLISIIVIIGFLSGVLYGCDKPEFSSISSQVSQITSESESSSVEVPYEERTLVKIATLKGPTGMGMVKLMSDNEEKLTANRYDFTIVGAPDEIVGKITTGEIDIAAVPTNLAATLYNRTEKNIQLLAINTLGVLYILEKGNTINSIGDLEGKTVFTSGKGSTPEFILNYILVQNGLVPEEDVTVEYKSEHSEVAALALAGQAEIVMLPEPFVTNVLSKNQGFQNVLDLTKEWDNVTARLGISDSVLSMGGIIARREFVQQNPGVINKFMDEYKVSVDFANSSMDRTAALIEKFEIMPSASLAKLAIPNSNIVFIEGQVMKNRITNLYNVFFLSDPKSIGGQMPQDDFYYIR